MKSEKLIIVLILLAVATSGEAKAQDTLTRRDSNFFYGQLDWFNLDTLHLWHSTIDDNQGEVRNPHDIGYDALIYSTWIDTAYADHNPPFSDQFGRWKGCWMFGNHILGNQMVTDRPLKIIGLAACGRMQRPADTTLDIFHQAMGSYLMWQLHRGEGWYFPNTRDLSMTGRTTDSLILYKPTNGDPIKLASGPWRVEWQHRNIVLPIEDSSRRCGLSSRLGPPLNDTPLEWDSIPTVALYEVYFDKPVVVEDSFIVAGTAFNNEGSYGWETTPMHEGSIRRWMWLWDHCPTRYWNLLREPQTNYYSNPSYYNDLENRREWDWDEQPRWIKYRNLPWGREPVYRNARIIFPIIEPDFDTMIEHCLPVENVRVAGSTDSTATLMWDASNSVRWEVRYGMLGMAWEDYHTVSTTVPTVILTGLQTGVQYRAYVRGWCDCDSNYTEWSNRLLFSVERSEDVARPGIVGRYTNLLPNPAREKVSVLSSYRMERIAVYDLNGRKVVEQEADGISAIVDVSTLPKGTYITAIYLPHGVATKKLMVE